VTTLTRVYRFSASHRLHSPLLSDAENAAIFGKCNNPYGHGHDYVVSITVVGPVDARTGLILQIADLDELVQTKVLHVLAHSNMNEDVPRFKDTVPTTENVAVFIAEQIQQNWKDFISAASPRLYRVHIQETERNGFELLIPSAASEKRIESEGVLIHA
jgi:6-pyruvoyltetrahydropterin/6-carboxytetrahydropterin synthase